MTRKFALVAVLALRCEAEPAPTPDAPNVEVSGDLGASEASESLPHDCATLLESHDVVALATAPDLCPEGTLPPHVLRAALLHRSDPADLAELQPRLESVPELDGLARLLLHAGVDAGSVPKVLPDPAGFSSIPIDDEVLGALALAHFQARSKDSTHEVRVAAMALLARIHLDAFASLGLSSEEALPPFAAILGARALHHGGEFCRAYVSRRVAGLERVFATSEEAMLRILRALEHTPPFADEPLVTVVRVRERSWLERAITAGRIEAGAPLIDRRIEIAALVDAGFVDLAVIVAHDEVERMGGEGVRAFVLERLRASGQQTHVVRATERMADIADTPAVVLPPAVPPWSDAASVAADIRARLLPLADEPFRRAYGERRLALELRSRPDARGFLLSPPPSAPAQSDAIAAEQMTRAARDAGLHDR